MSITDPLYQKSETEKYKDGVGSYLSPRIGGSGFIPKMVLDMELPAYWKEFLLEAWREGSTKKVYQAIKADRLVPDRGGPAVPHVYLGLEQARVLKLACKETPGRLDVADMVRMPSGLSQAVYQAAITGESEVLPEPVVKSISKLMESVDSFDVKKYRAISMLLKDFADDEEDLSEEGEEPSKPLPDYFKNIHGWKALAYAGIGEEEGGEEGGEGEAEEGGEELTLKGLVNAASHDPGVEPMHTGEVSAPVIVYPKKYLGPGHIKSGVFDFDKAMKTVEELTVDPKPSASLELTANTRLDQVVGLIRPRIIVDRKGPFVKAEKAHRLIVGDTRVFGRVEKVEEAPIEIVFAVDCSGSMSHLWRTVLGVSGSISHAFMRAGAESATMGFVSTLSKCYFSIFKRLEDPFEPQRFWPAKGQGNGNPDAVAVEWCRRHLVANRPRSRQAKAKFIVVFSDEVPAGPCPSSVYNDKVVSHYDALNQAIYRCDLSGVQVISACVPQRYNANLEYHAKVEIQDVDTTLENLVSAIEVLMR